MNIKKLKELINSRKYTISFFVFIAILETIVLCCIPSTPRTLTIEEQVNWLIGLTIAIPILFFILINLPSPEEEIKEVYDGIISFIKNIRGKKK
ncbi:MAG: hypothetical protein QW272_05320 [Candidatus Methanomethylicaceae archaeon]